MGKKRRTKVAIQHGWKDLRRNSYYDKCWKFNPNCTEEHKRLVEKIRQEKKCEGEE